MALQRNRHAQNSGNLLGDNTQNRHHHHNNYANSENAPIAKKLMEKQTTTTAGGGGGGSSRSAFSNLSNKTNSSSQNAALIQKKHLKKNSTTTLSMTTTKENNIITTRSKTKEVAAKQQLSKIKENVEMEKINQISTSGTVAMEMETDNKVVVTTTLFDDVDKDDRSNPQLVSEYVQNVYAYLRQLEMEMTIKEDYLSISNGGGVIKPRMRKILVDWLVQVHTRFHLLQETLYITISLIDRFLQNSTIARNQLQLVGVTAMLIASKYEEMYSPEVNDFVYISDKTYKKEEILEMEMIMLRKLDFRLGKPIPLHFLRRFSKLAEVNALKHGLAKYLMELCLTEYCLCHILPSKIAAAALNLSMKVLDGGGDDDDDDDAGNKWTDLLVHHSTYKEVELKDLMQKMASLVKKASVGKITSVYRKYCGSKNLSVATLPELKGVVINSLAAQCDNAGEDLPPN